MTERHELAAGGDACNLTSLCLGLPVLRPAAEAVCTVDPLRLRVGEVYDSGVRRWPGQELVLTTEGCVLIVDIAPTPEQLDQFHTAEARFAWGDGRHHGILSCRFGSMPWEFFLFNPQRDTPAGKTPGMPAVMPGSHVDVAVGLARGEQPVTAIRTVQWPEYFASAVAATVSPARGAAP
ncbi:hypothetical protein ACP6C3_31090 [Mycolicibacterium septicum]|uniref:Uncharacterized protein n=1 Tax=Mycolicibacterium septicum TaxID=98668 RepID=A0ABW9M309_9MYCO